MKTESEKNRDDAYLELVPTLGLRQATVLSLITTYRELTISEIALKMRLGTNHISGRIGELEQRCLIRIKGSKKNLNTKVKNTVWEVIPISERKAAREVKINVLTEKAVHLAVDLGNVASVSAINLISKEIFRTDQKLALLI